MSAGFEILRLNFAYSDIRLKPALHGPMRMAATLRRYELPDVAVSHAVRILSVRRIGCSRTICWH
jgi:hypothetical protein